MSAEKIRELNDAFRTTMTGGRVMMTAGIDALPSDVKAMVIRRVATFSHFNADNDPHKEHDFGNFTLTGRKFFWKIDAYDADMRFRLGRSGRPIEDNSRPHDHARERVLIPCPAVRGAIYCRDIFDGHHVPRRR